LQKPTYLVGRPNKNFQATIYYRTTSKLFLNFTAFLFNRHFSPYNRLVTRGESKPEGRSGKRIIAGTAFGLEFLVGWYYDADATMAVPELY